jgi:hypothetical protein
MSSEDYPYPLMDKDGKLICQLCGESFLVISPKHLGKHDIRYSEYKLRFPDAPLSTSEFAASSRYGRVKNIFDDEEIIVEDEMENLEEEFEGMEDPEIVEEIDIDKLTQTIHQYKDPMQQRKSKILDHLRSFFSNIQQDYMIQLIDGGGFLRSEFITDFADPVLKIDIEFPDVFWHNEGFLDPNRDNKLKVYGWKIITISGNGPSSEKISKCISEQL